MARPSIRKNQNGAGRYGYDIGEGDLRSINAVQVSDRARVVLTLRNTMQHDAKVDGRDLLVTLAARGRASN